eukprot:243212-Pelagomonas_calceolata.AAC.2
MFTEHLLGFVHGVGVLPARHLCKGCLSNAPKPAMTCFHTGAAEGATAKGGLRMGVAGRRGVPDLSSPLAV